MILNDVLQYVDLIQPIEIWIERDKKDVIDEIFISKSTIKNKYKSEKVVYIGSNTVDGYGDVLFIELERC